MITFLESHINSKFRNKLIIMDNAPSHRSRMVKEFLLKKNNTLLYSVPYKPKTNCIENWFNQFKHYLKLSDFITFDELNQAVFDSI